MCLILFAYKAHPDYPFILAANRDEFYGRPALRADFWSEHPTILAGKDVQAGGTWCGITTHGRFAALTNYRDLRSIKENAPSRGNLTTWFLTAEHNAASSGSDYGSWLDANASEYNGYNILFGNLASGGELWYQSNQGAPARALEAGIYGVSNALLDTPWQKVERGKRVLQAVIQEGSQRPQELASSLLNMMSDTERAPDAQLPETGVGIDLERVLSSMFIASPNYGTRCSTVILVDTSNHATFVERTHTTPEQEASERAFSFEILGSRA